jgi:hypothetical protein
LEKETINETELVARFRSPGARYRSLLFWAWNSQLDEDELRRQIQEMHRAGAGGFFIHSRDGLETPYMGAAWKALTRASVLAARELGLEAWLYDEDRWPSGTAGGTVPARWGDDSRCKGLTLEVCAPGTEPPAAETLARYGARVRDMAIDSLRRLEPGEGPGTGETVLALRLEVSGKSDWFNGEAPPDNLNPRSVRHFLEATHDEYKAVCGEFFGALVPGIFTDEPSLHDRHAKFPGNRGWIPWTSGFGEYFAERRGYDPLDTIPYLYFNGDKSAKIRHDYWRTITERYAESYSGEIAAWCRVNGIAYTGHFLQEDKLGLAVRVNGGIMPHYYYQDIPGIDLLREQTGEYLTVKQCTSVARQYGKPVVLSESYGCTGWDFSFEGQKWVGDWQYVLGVNRLVKHMALYTLKGCGKRDYPPSFNYNNTWWNYARPMEDYHGRLSAVLSAGEPLRDLAVLHPASTAWSRLGCSPYGNPVRNQERDVPAVNRYGQDLNEFLARLSGFHYDYDLADELLMGRDGSVRDGSLVIGRAAYRLMILPPVDTLLESTRALLEEFLAAGGFLIALRPLPWMIEGEPQSGAAALFRHPRAALAEDYAGVEKLLEARLDRRVEIRGEDGEQDRSILYLLKDLGDFYTLFVVNNDRRAARPVRISLPPRKTLSLRRLGLLSGEDRAEYLPGGVIEETLGPADSRLYLIEKEGPGTDPAAAGPPPPDPAASRETFYRAFPPECRVRRNLPNTLTLDTCRWRFEDGPESEEMEVWQAQRQIRAALGMADISLNGMVQRYRWAGRSHRADGRETALVFRFTAAASLEGLDLALEEAGEFRVRLNGAEVPRRISGWFLDRGIDRLSLPPLREGENRLELFTPYKNRTQLEDIYLCGDFSVDSRRRLLPEEPWIRTGDWTLQGYPHYAGSLTYGWDFFHSPPGEARVILKVEEFAAVTLRLRVNDSWYEIPWKAAASVDITGSLVENAVNRIAVEVVGSPRNLLGPFHLMEGKAETVSDRSFHPPEAEHSPGYNLAPCGLFSPPRLYLKNNSGGI